MHIADGCAGRDGSLDLAEVFFGFAEELFSFAVVGRGFVFLRKGLGVGGKVEVAEALLALTGEFDGLHQRDLKVAGGILGVYEGVMMGQVNLTMEEVSGGGKGLKTFIIVVF